jgi:two-component system CitB family sensor kinase
VLVNDRVLVANRMPVALRGRDVGAVLTLRDRTELEGLLRELHDVRSLAEALRAQEHEFSNRLHVIAGLIELGRSDDALEFISEASHVHQALVASIVEHVGEPMLAALLLGKAAVASERGIELRLSDDTEFAEHDGDVRDLVTVVGNLVDNALDSVAAAGGLIEVAIVETDEGVLVRVRDSGPGIDPALADEIFRDGYTTKIATGTGRRGLGLALVSQTVRRAGGYVTVTNDSGALFTAFLPRVPAGVETAP